MLDCRLAGLSGSTTVGVDDNETTRQTRSAGDAVDVATADDKSDACTHTNTHTKK